jgi:prepilin-type N-terminal cleavage/methylation domain-containing protein
VLVSFLLGYTVAMTRQHRRPAGYSLVELVVVVAMISIVSSFAVPTLLRYYQTAKVRGAAQTVSAILNQGRQLAIRNNLTTVATCITTTTITFRQTNCGGATIPVVGLTGAGNSIRLPEGINLTTSGTATFTNLGAATPGATYTVTDPVSTRTMTVTVAASGRITIP